MGLITGSEHVGLLACEGEGACADCGVVVTRTAAARVFGRRRIGVRKGSEEDGEGWK